jgi:GNAT superfamily N-acetyltransferase
VAVEVSAFSVEGWRIAVSDSAAMRVEVSTLVERPELRHRLHEIGSVFPAFMSHDLVENALHGRVLDEFPEYCVVATDEQGMVVGHGRSIPFALGPRDGLPDSGWDAVLMWGFEDHHSRTPTDAVSALIVTVAPSHTGKGISPTLFDALRSAASRQGHRILVAPVRPNWKDREPTTPMGEYVARVRDDGLPYDPWLRTHVRLGGVIERVAPASMTISGSLTDWRRWTGLPFDREGEVEVPGALVPVRCDIRHDHAVYVEPNVWVRHDLG